jgi:hypothetical protein
MGAGRAMEEANQKPHLDDEDDEFLDGSHSNKNADAQQHLDRHHNHQRDANQAEDPSSAAAAPFGGVPAATPASKVVIASSLRQFARNFEVFMCI